MDARRIALGGMTLAAVLAASIFAAGAAFAGSPSSKHQSALTHHAARKGGKRRDKQGATGSRRADLPIKGVSTSSGALPTAKGIGGLRNGSPVSGLLGAAK